MVSGVCAPHGILCMYVLHMISGVCAPHGIWCMAPPDGTMSSRPHYGHLGAGIPELVYIHTCKPQYGIAWIGIAQDKESKKNVSWPFFTPTPFAPPKISQPPWVWANAKFQCNILSILKKMHCFLFGRFSQPNLIRWGFHLWAKCLHKILQIWQVFCIHIMITLLLLQ